VVVIPPHGVVKRDNLASILRHAGLTPAEFLELLDLHLSLPNCRVRAHDILDML
jgi:hypothetical protein